MVFAMIFVNDVSSWHLQSGAKENLSDLQVRKSNLKFSRTPHIREIDTMIGSLYIISFLP